MEKTLQQLGYSYHFMISVELDEALMLFGLNVEVYEILLYEDTESLIFSKEDIIELYQAGAFLGVDLNDANYIKKRMYDEVEYKPIRMLKKDDLVLISKPAYRSFNSQDSSYKEYGKEKNGWYEYVDYYLIEDEDYGYPSMLYYIIKSLESNPVTFHISALEIEMETINEYLIKKDAGPKLPSHGLPVI